MASIETKVQDFFDNSDYGIMVFKHKDGFISGIKGHYAQVAFAIGQIVYDMHKQTNIPLKDIGAMINAAVETRIEGDEE